MMNLHTCLVTKYQITVGALRSFSSSIDEHIVFKFTMFCFIQFRWNIQILMASLSNVQERTTLNIWILFLGENENKQNLYPIPNDPIIENLMQFQHFKLFRLKWCCYNAIEQINKTIFSLSCQRTTIIVTADFFAVGTLNILPIHWNTYMLPIYMYLCVPQTFDFLYSNYILKLKWFYLFVSLLKKKKCLNDLGHVLHARIDSIHTIFMNSNFVRLILFENSQPFQWTYGNDLSIVYRTHLHMHTCSGFCQ